MKALLLAGGKGTRLWPLSRAETPKQILSPFGKGQKNLLQQSIDRLLNLGFDPKNISLVTAKDQISLLQKYWSDNLGQIIAEPSAQNTGSAILLSCKKLMEEEYDPYASIFIFPSDIYTQNLNFDFIKKLNLKDIILCYRVIPNRVEKNYGYIQTHTGGIIRKVRRFVEKPDQETAKSWYQDWISGNDLSEEEKYFWNAGIYTLSLNSLAIALEFVDPELYQLWKNSSYEEFLESYSILPKLPFDKLIAEKTFNLHSASLDATLWRDIGSWESIHESLRKEKKENIAIDQGEIIATEDSIANLVLSDQKFNIALAGVEDLAVVISGKNILITKKDNPQSMVKLIDMMKNNHKDLL